MRLMIDSDPNAQSYADVGLWGRATLDALFKRNLARAPDRLAMCDGTERKRWSGRPALRLTFRQADDIISALAGRFIELGLRQGSVVAVSLPNCVEAFLTILACGRAGLVPAVMPFLWRASDVSRALEPLAAKALITITRAGDDMPADFMRYAAAELFAVRYVMAFGADAPDGVMSLDEYLNGVHPRDVRFPPSSDAPADQAALITFATQPSGPIAIARSHNHCVCSGLVNVLEVGLEPGDVIATSLMPTGIASLSSSLFPWLLTGGTLLLHQPFDLAGFNALIEQEKVKHAVVPGAFLGDLAPRIGDGSHRLLRTLIGVHGDGARAGAFDPVECKTDIVDVVAFDEFGVAARRRRKGVAQALTAGPLYHPADSESGPVLIETKIGGDGTVMVKGPQVPYSGKFGEGYRPTTLRVGKHDTSLAVLKRLTGVAYVGGLGVGTGEIEKQLLASDDVDAVKVTVVHDPLFGQRIEAQIAPRLNGATQGEALVQRIQARFASAGIAAYKTPTMIRIEHRLRGDMHARQRGVSQGS
ncbi:MAG: hypothetical protein A4S15_06280 [Candidatus Raskinella chloraquaticus]|jgi:mycobactin salicyl-AMP ligase|uniref:AMP-dependent synthetase/ligase domain-containing protein n=2 Tax=Candidatus Raskinella chloraquaticus TaxID=1951219 RepID=A0A1W9I099_9HYPH|nr:MAG: hypothetical protein A4S15_06280 [Proteobacteria bacterium SG_bin8]